MRQGLLIRKPHDTEDRSLATRIFTLIRLTNRRRWWLELVEAMTTCASQKHYAGKWEYSPRYRAHLILHGRALQRKIASVLGHSDFEVTYLHGVNDPRWPKYLRPNFYDPHRQPWVYLPDLARVEAEYSETLRRREVARGFRKAMRAEARAKKAAEKAKQAD